MAGVHGWLYGGTRAPLFEETRAHHMLTIFVHAEWVRTSASVLPLSVVAVLNALHSMLPSDIQSNVLGDNRKILAQLEAMATGTRPPTAEEMKIRLAKKLRREYEELFGTGDAKEADNRRVFT